MFVETVMDVVAVSGGTVENIQVNSILVTFNAHRASTYHEECACECAYSLSASLFRLFKDQWWSISIAAGSAITGNCGTVTQRSRIVYGEPCEAVQKLARLQLLIGCRIAITEKVARRVRCATVPIDFFIPRWDAAIASNEVVVHQLLYSEPKPLHTRWSDTLQLLRKGSSPATIKSQLLEFPSADSAMNELLFQKNRWLTICETSAAVQASRTENYFNLHGGEKAFARDPFVPSVDDVEQCCHLSSSAPLVAVAELRAQAEHRPQIIEDSTSFVPLLSIDQSNQNAAEEVPAVIRDNQAHEWRRFPRPIAKGACGAIYRAIDERTGRQCVMKVLPLRLWEGEGNIVETIVEEVTHLASMFHRNIVSYISAATTGQQFCIFMEYVPCGSLQDLIQLGPLQRCLIIRILEDVVDGLRYIHEKGIVHCDLKPDNVLLTEEGSAKVADFGSSVRRFVSPNSNDNSHGERLSPGNSRGAVLRGTPCYMAPESLRGVYNEKTDVWSVGIVLLQALCGENPWGNKHTAGQGFLLELSQGNIVPDIDALKGVRLSKSSTADGELFSLAKQCCQREPDDRPSLDTIYTFLQQLDALGGQ